MQLLLLFCFIESTTPQGSQEIITPQGSEEIITPQGSSALCIENETCGELKQLRESVKYLKSEVAHLNSKTNDLEKKLDYLAKLVEPVKYFPASCQELASTGETENGIFQIQPTAEIDPFNVTCRFHGRVGTTVISHDHQEVRNTSNPMELGGCFDAGCYTDDIKYDLDLEQIYSLVKLSLECKQVITNNCTNSKLTGMAWWGDRNGENHTYWHGNAVKKSFSGCSCSIESNDCDNHHFKDNLCNCDDLGENAIDAGTLSNRDLLPVTQLNYGDGGGRFSWIFYKLGNLECSGKPTTAVYPSDIGKGLINYYFKWFASKSWNLSTEKNIAMSMPSVDQSLQSYNRSTGDFTAPVFGHYKFDLHLLLVGVSRQVQYNIYIKVNNKVVEKFQSDRYQSETNRNNRNNYNYNYHSASSTLLYGDSNFITTEVDLQKGDTVKWYINQSKHSYKTVDGCFINGEESGCSFIQGKLMTRY